MARSADGRRPVSENSGNGKHRVLLVASGERGGYLHLPLSILYLAEALLRGGYEVSIVDLRVRDVTEQDLDGALFVGVSHMTGSMQIPPALRCADLARSRGIPVVFGGTHPSVLPEQTAAHPLVDVVVKGEGEETVLDLAEYFAGHRSLETIPGIAYRQPDGRVVSTGDRSPPPFDRATHLPYHLLSMEKYRTTASDFAVQSSRGCPHRCAFCAEIGLYQRGWRAKPARALADEVEAIVAGFHPERIFFVDSNFFCNTRRVTEFCEIVIARKLPVRFFAECRFDYFARYPREFLLLLKRAGFNEIEFGGESGSDATLRRIKKDITREQILQGIRRCREVGLRSFTSFMIGFPGETRRARMETLSVYDEIHAVDPDGARVNGMFVYSPFPGTELFRLVRDRYGFRPPDSLDGWGRFELYDADNVTWLDDDEKGELQTISTLVRFFFVWRTLCDWGLRGAATRHGGAARAALSFLFNGLFVLPARVRWRLRFFRFGWEWRLWRTVFHAFMGRK